MPDGHSCRGLRAWRCSDTFPRPAASPPTSRGKAYGKRAPAARRVVFGSRKCNEREDTEERRRAGSGRRATTGADFWASRYGEVYLLSAQPLASVRGFRQCGVSVSQCGVSVSRLRFRAHCEMWAGRCNEQQAMFKLTAAYKNTNLTQEYQFNTTILLKTLRTLFNYCTCIILLSASRGSAFLS